MLMLFACYSPHSGLVRPELKYSTSFHGLHLKRAVDIGKYVRDSNRMVRGLETTSPKKESKKHKWRHERGCQTFMEHTSGVKHNAK
jgi:sarcosine oxidase delta subunit